MTPDEVVAAWVHATTARQYALRREAEAVTCPMPDCNAQPGESCSYSGPVIDSETGATTGMQRVVRAAHLERVAVFTDRRLFGYTLRQLENRQQGGRR